MGASRSYHEYLVESFKDPKEALGCLNVALEEGDVELFLLMLGQVVEARGGVPKSTVEALKQEAETHKGPLENYLKGIKEILRGLGFHLAVAAEGRTLMVVADDRKVA